MSAGGALPGVFQTLAPVLDKHGYLAVAGFIFLEDFGVPVPGETILIAGAVYAGSGRLNVVALGLIAVAAAVLGDNVGFGIGYFGGSRLVVRYGRFVFLTQERLAKAQRWFTRHGGKIVVVARFIEGLRQANGIVAGTTRMHWAKFLLFNALGATLWVAVWVTIGYASGSHIDAIYTPLSRALYGLAGLAVVILLFRVVRHRRNRAEGSSAAASHASTDGQS